MNRGLAPHTLVGAALTNTDAGGLASTRTDTVPAGREQGHSARNLAAFPARGPVRTSPKISNDRRTPPTFTRREIEAATTSNVCGTATSPRTPLSALVAADSNARAHQLAKDTNSSHDETGARETRHQRDATTA